jgi:alcohol dehydrogenase (cytochrome c)
VLLDADWNSQPRKLLVLATRNGFLYVLDRTNGKFLSAKAFGKVTWTPGIAADGKPLPNGALEKADGERVCPGALGMTNWYSPSYSPQTKLFYVATSNECDIFTNAPQKYRAGHDFLGSVYVPDPVERPRGALKAIDPLTGEIKWEFPYFSNPNGGALSTAGGVVFAGDSDGNFIALDAGSGHDLWHVQLGAAVYSTAITYAVDGKQYVAVPVGAALFAFGLEGR